MSYRSTIARQPEALADTHAAVRDQLATLDLSPFDRPVIGITGIGASFAAAVVGAGELQARGRRAFAIRACDMAYGHDLVDTLVGLSAGGRSVETVLAHQKLPTAKRIGISKDGASPLAQASDIHVTLKQGSDATPSSTGYTATLLAMGMVFEKLLGGTQDSFADIPAQAAEVIDHASQKMKRLGELFPSRRAIDCVGLGASLGTADGASLLIREASRIPASAYDTRHYLHGPLEAMDASTGVVIFGDGREVELARQVEAIGCPALLVTTARDASDGDLLTTVSVPKLDNLIAQEILKIFVAQLFAAELSDAANLTDVKFRYRMSDTKIAAASA
ncbi:SIS domain-containing protein [Consotaella salsifontis]|uniref:Glutamine--fructose-6-phosphate aminotransferase [isomerizing] n=1 Tax=Consotaella salsifontis TaxID=1365950 RepID=A0A1T4SG75_9HYPH|nr:glucosamine--fructose-6-phosphate aminotransferase [Consotaella salsifontis]SKA27195.1 glucosamine--fructose-6-phosphate aminotransferase (isomerizing) [Consotaella salsifontis]